MSEDNSCLVPRDPKLFEQDSSNSWTIDLLKRNTTIHRKDFMLECTIAQQELWARLTLPTTGLYDISSKRMPRGKPERIYTKTWECFILMMHENCQTIHAGKGSTQANSWENLLQHEWKPWLTKLVLDELHGLFLQFCGFSKTTLEARSRKYFPPLDLK